MAALQSLIVDYGSVFVSVHPWYLGPCTALTDLSVTRCDLPLEWDLGVCVQLESLTVNECALDLLNLRACGALTAVACSNTGNACLRMLLGARRLESSECVVDVTWPRL